MVEHSFTINLGYNVYKDGWDTLIIGKVLYCEREIENYNDRTHFNIATYLTLCTKTTQHSYIHSYFYNLIVHC